jgi:hypothetical protein
MSVNLKNCNISGPSIKSWIRVKKIFNLGQHYVRIRRTGSWVGIFDSRKMDRVLWWTVDC